MASDAQILANRRNALLSRGPTTARGRFVSSQNARKHGLRASVDSVLRDAGIAFEERRLKWLRELTPRTDREEFLANQQIVTGVMLERVQRAHNEHVTSEIKNVDIRRAEDARQLGERLFFNRCGPAASYGYEPLRPNKLQTSFSGIAADPDHPAKLVMELEQTGAGCWWLIEQWTALKERLEGNNFWQAIDRFRAVRLLGCRPTDAGHDRVIAEIYVASYALEPPREKPDYGFEQEEDSIETEPFQDLKSDYTPHVLIQFANGTDVRWPDMVNPEESGRCREFLVDLVDRNIEMLSAILVEHERHKEQDAEQLVGQQGFSQSYEAELMRRYELRYGNAFDRTVRTYERVTGQKPPEYEEPARRPFHFGAANPNSHSAGKPGETVINSATVACAGDSGRWTLDEDRTWRREICEEDVRACGGLVPKRCVAGIWEEERGTSAESEGVGELDRVAQIRDGGSSAIHTGGAIATHFHPGGAGATHVHVGGTSDTHTGGGSAAHDHTGGASATHEESWNRTTPFKGAGCGGLR